MIERNKESSRGEWKNGKMEKELLVSIVTPSYNQGEFIEDTILSVKNQDYPNIEHIIVDGGSTDNTLEILRKYEGSYNMRWISEPDEGMYEAINKGLKTASGDILAYLNSDDLYVPWTVETVVQYLNRHPKTDLAYGDLIKVDLSTGRIFLSFYPHFDLKFLIRTGFLGQPTVFFRKSVVRKVGLFDETLELVGDCEYWMRVGKKCQISKVEEFLAVDRIHPNTQREKKFKKLHEELDYVRKTHGVGEGWITELLQISDKVKRFLVSRYLMVEFLSVYILQHRSYNSKIMEKPWSNLMNSESFRISSLHSFFIEMVPWISTRHKGNWFNLELLALCNSDEGGTND